MRVNAFQVNQAIVNGSGAEGILFADVSQFMDVITGLMAVSVDVDAALAYTSIDFTHAADGTAQVDADVLAYLADQLIDSVGLSVIDSDAVATLDGMTLTVFVREAVRRHIGASQVDPHGAGAALVRHGGGSAAVEHGTSQISVYHQIGTPIVRH